MVVTIVAGLVSAVVITVYVGSLQRSDVKRAPFVTLYDSPRSRLDVALVLKDGQFYAAIAQDPTLARPGVFRTEHAAADLSYRGARPLFPYATWAVSLGQPSWVPYAMVVLVALGCALAAGALGWLLAERSVNPLFALVVLVLPGTIWSLVGITPEPVGLGLAALGLGLLAGPKPRLIPATILLTLAALTRETMLLVPVGLLAWALWYRRRELVAVCVIPVVVYAAWTTAVVARVGSAPLRAPLFTGVTGLGDADNPAVVVLSVLLALIVAAYALAIRSRDPLAWIAAAFCLLFFVYGSESWTYDYTMARTLLPSLAFAGVVIATRFATRSVRPHRDP